MPAYPYELHRPRCQACSAQATHELRNSANAPVAPYCKRHAEAALKAFQRVFEERP